MRDHVGSSLTSAAAGGGTASPARVVGRRRGVGRGTGGPVATDWQGTWVSAGRHQVALPSGLARASGASLAGGILYPRLDALVQATLPEHSRAAGLSVQSALFSAVMIAAFPGFGALPGRFGPPACLGGLMARGRDVAAGTAPGAHHVDAGGARPHVAAAQWALPGHLPWGDRARPEAQALRRVAVAVAHAQVKAPPPPGVERR